MFHNFRDSTGTRTQEIKRVIEVTFGYLMTASYWNNVKSAWMSDFIGPTIKRRQIFRIAVAGAELLVRYRELCDCSCRRADVKLCCIKEQALLYFGAGHPMGPLPKLI